MSRVAVAWNWLLARPRLAAGCLVAWFCLAGLTGTMRHCATFDEVAHLPAGYSYLARGDFRMNPEHPPLAKEVAALPLLAMRPHLPDDDSDWLRGQEWPFGQAFLYDWNDPERLLFWGRLPMLLLAAGFGLLLAAAARAFYGVEAGLLALLLYVLTPEFLAHGALVTTDFAVAAALFCAVYAFSRALQRPSWPRLLAFAAATGACLASKYSGLLILPILVVLATVYLALPGRLAPAGEPDDGSAGVVTVQQRLSRLGVIATAGTAGCLLILWACYGFRFGMTADPELSRRIPWGRFDPGQLSTRLVLGLHTLRLLPEAYLYGLLDCLKSLAGREAFLFGEHSTRGWWYYYLVTFALKTPLPLLALLGLAAGSRCGRLWPSVLMLLPAGVYLVVSLGSQVNIGNRHILPIYPFLIVQAAGMARAPGLGRRGMRTVLAALLLWMAVGTIRAYPDFLAYTNELAGEPLRAGRYLADSNLDWGQDLKALGRYREEYPTIPLFVSYFGAADPRHYLRDAIYLPSFYPVRGVAAVPFDDVPRGATVAISLTNLNGVNIRGYPGAESFLAGLREQRPLARVGATIYIYRLPE